MTTHFTHCHVHSELSPDGLGRVEKLVERAKILGYDTLACTDHGTLGAAVSFWSACQSFDVKPIFGNEAYFEWNGKRHHITLNALNKEGFHNLIALNNAAHVNWTSGFPLTTVEHLNRYAKGIAMFTGCPASPLHEGSEADAANFVGTMHDIFGDRLYLEMMFVLDDDTVGRPYRMHQKFGIPIIVTNDVHFTHEIYKPIHAVLTECRKGFSYDSNRLFMKTPEQMLASGLKHFDEALVKKWLMQAYDFGQSVEKWSMISKPVLPDASALLPKLFEDIQHGFIEDIARVGDAHREERQARLDYEMKVLKETGFLEYFAILHDFISWARSQGIVIGPGRGSAAGSYILYLLKITGVDPIFYNLYFDRFINEKRREFPDVDIDIESDRRHEVIDYVKKRWGAHPIATYSTYAHKILVNDLSSHLKIDIKASEKAADEGPDSDAFAHWVTLDPRLRTAYEVMSGQVRHAGKHAGGVVITDQPVPIEKIGDDLVVAWIEGSDKELSKVGVVKYDILGLTALSQLRRMRELSGIDFEKLVPEENIEPLQIFRDGDVLGIFQWTGSDGIRNLTMKIAPTTFDDLCVINSLYRPGALDAGTADLYPEFKKTPRKFHPEIDAILADTYGVIVFQEQVMALFAKVVGGSLADADIARRVIFKIKPGDPVWEKSVRDMRERFITTGIAQGFDEPMLVKLWNEIQTHCRYSFNRAHSASYARIAYWMAWYKLYYPEIFYSVMMTYDDGNIQSYTFEVVQKGIKILLPTIESPTSEVLPIGKGIVQLPLNVVKFLSEATAEKIISEVKVNGHFKSMEDFKKRIPKRMCNTRVEAALTAIGAFDSFPDVVSSDRTIANQLDILGFVIPTPQMVEYILENNDDKNNVCGFVSSWNDKVNKRGNSYRVFRLSPHGMFWSDNMDRNSKIEKGDLLAVTKNAFGKAMSVKRLKVEA